MLKTRGVCARLVNAAMEDGLCVLELLHGGS
jgi:hypothetical protein